MSEAIQMLMREHRLIVQVMGSLESFPPASGPAACSGQG